MDKVCHYTRRLSKSKNESGEECFEMKNYTVYVRVIDRNEYERWAKEHGSNDPYAFSEGVEEKMQTEWSEKEGSWDVRSGWTNRDHEWDRFIEAFYAVYRKEPVVSKGTYDIEGKVLHSKKGVGGYENHVITIHGLVPHFETRKIGINESQGYILHSDGYEWGYGGSGPAQTSLAILLEVLPSDIALNNYMRFKNEVMSRINQGTDFKIRMDVRDDQIIYFVSFGVDFKFSGHLDIEK